MKYTPVLLLTGYLGSGKTTLLNRILNNRRGIRFAVIVNDLGEVNIDAALIQKGGVVGGADQGDLVALQNGCICCTLKMDLVRQLMDIVHTGRFDYIVIEASGICEPAPIAQTITAIPAMAGDSPVDGLPRLDCIATVVDALRLADEFGSGESLRRTDLGEEDLERLVIEQIEFCNIILLNKISEVSADTAARIRAVLRAIQPKAEIIDCDYCDVPLERLLDTGLFDFERVATSAAWVEGIEGPAPEQMEEDDDHDDDHHHGHQHHDHDHCDGHCHHHHHHHHGEGEAEEYGISTWVYFRRRPFDFEKFDRFVATAWPRSVIRAKGVLYFSHHRDMSVLFEQAGSQKKLTEAGLWYATAPADQLAAMMARDPALRRDWDEEYGDRMDKIVFIGRDMDREAITAALDACLA
ncbi:MAG: GTP-binding protein [Bacteroides sp.]|nr:GTP-binding protein [Bacteroides sp.]MCM1096266.1 GTP-binding protein [Terasakiella sp.]